MVVHTGSIGKPYRFIGTVEAKRSKASLYSSSPKTEDVNDELRQKAADLGANAIIEVRYSRKMSLLSYEVLKATGSAVWIESDERTCPFCAELIKSGALICKHCNSKLPAA